jgi:DNA-binding IclR family transcriptional regulator
METTSNNHALRLLKTLKSMAGPDGEVHIDLYEVCRAAGLDENDLRECIADLENEGYLSSEIVVQIAEEWR